MGPQQFLPIFPPRNSCAVLVDVRYVDGAIKLDIFVFRKYYMADRVIKCKRRQELGPGRGRPGKGYTSRVWDSRLDGWRHGGGLVATSVRKEKWHVVSL